MRWITLLIILPAWSWAFANDSPEALQAAFMNALRTNDVNGLAACYTEDATNFPVGSLAGVGPDSVRTSWNGFFADFRVTSARLTNEHMEKLGDTAVAWGLFIIMAEPVGGGDPVEMQGRYMDVSRNIDGQWLYIADHASIPVPAQEK
jgi:uncharacterized protein (TIGR02246 family)